MTTNTDPVRALIGQWRGTHGSGFTSQGEFQAHLSTLRTCADELEAALASALPGAPSDDLPTLLDNLMRAAFDDGDRGREKFSGATMAARAAVLAHVRGASAPPSAPAGEVCIRLNGIGEGGPYPVVNGVCVLPQSVAENLVASTVGQQVKRELLAQWASYKQPAAPSGEAVGAWVTVPRIPTDAMLDAMHGRIRILCNPAKRTADIQNDVEVWGAMLEAAPQQPAAVDEAMVERALNAQPFAESRNSGVRVWQLFLDERDAGAIIRAALTAALAAPQQPASGEEIMVNTPYDVFTLPLQPSGLLSGPRFVVHVPAPEQQPAAPSGTRNFREILAEREAQSPGITAKIEERTAELVAAPQQPAGRVHDLAARLVDELDGLVGESDGVSGLHRNGDVATWDELLPGGRFERLSSLNELRAALAAQQQGGRADA